MKNKKSFPNFFFHPNLSCRQAGSSGLKIILLLVLNAFALAQEQSTQEELVFGTAMHRNYRDNQAVYDSFHSAGLNYLTQYADPIYKGLLDGINFSAYNGEHPFEWIQYYSTSYYSKWEAEEDQIEKYRVGFKHREDLEDSLLGDLIGSPAIYPPNTGRQCWSTEGLTSARDSLIYGPHYFQEKEYKRWYLESYGYKRYNLFYTPRFIMALDTLSYIGSTDTICRLSVIARYRLQEDGFFVNNYDSDTLLKSIVLTAADFSPYGEFKEFYLIDTADYYIYPEEFRESAGENKRDFSGNEGEFFFDRWGDQGIQFRVDWLGDNSKCNLYIDYVEVYDNDGGHHFANQPTIVTNRVVGYAEEFPQSVWPNLKYWGGPDEPQSLDNYTPMKTVDAILESIGAPRLITKFYPWWEVTVNGDTQLVRYYNTVHPKILMIDFFPFLEDWYPARFDDWEATRTMFQICHTLQPGFWYQAQAFGVISGGQWDGWRFPDTSEFKAQTMLALAHGVKGIINEAFTSLGGAPDGWQGILNDDGTPFLSLNGSPDSLNYVYKIIKYNLAPRLNGKLGKTLMSLDYSGDYIQRYYTIPTENPFPNPQMFDYLTLGYPASSAHDMFWHCGFFNRPNQLDNKYFLLANLYQFADSKTISVRVTPPIQGYCNYRFRNVEGYFDETFNTEIIKNLIHPKGEGYLYQVAPVVKYGGKLIYNDTLSSSITLIDDMTIKNNATLTVNTMYNVDRNITIQDEGSIISTSGGTINFYNDEKLIIEGDAVISGTSQNKLVLDFQSPADSNGIVIKSGGSLTISYCEIKNAGTGILSELNGDSLIIQYVDFIDCEDNSISIAGRSGGDYEPPIQISNCSLENSEYGISVYNTASILIQDNDITDTDCGIYLSNVNNAQIINNTVESVKEELQGIYSSSSGGIMRGNEINGHTVGIHLANSSPKLGENTITDNKYHGIYIGSGSNPYMRGEYAGSPPVWYAISGYNVIKENGGYYESGGPSDNDGSEIYFYNSNAVLDTGCNQIVDDRTASPPLINTLYLMNGQSSGFPITVQAQYNFWGDTVYAARFGSLNVYFTPYETEPCPEPQSGGGEEEMVMMNQFRMVVDTVYSTGLAVPTLSETDLDYAEAEEYYLTGDLTSALLIYESIISSGATDEEKYLAYERKYAIGRMINESPEFFNNLSSSFANLASNTQDSLAIKRLTQFSTLSKVGEQEYETAIDEFDGIVQQNPNTEEAVYAEIDALTTALLVEENDSTLQKGRLGKYLVKSSVDYHQKVDEILRKHFGGNSNKENKSLIPTEFTLYQNYPNPFNPATTIKYDLPNASDVSLIIYDILGRRVKELVNTKQPAGRYEIQFNASNFASGVYIYQLVSEKYINSKKMVLLK